MADPIKPTPAAAAEEKKKKGDALKPVPEVQSSAERQRRVTVRCSVNERCRYGETRFTCVEGQRITTFEEAADWLVRTGRASKV